MVLVVFVTHLSLVASSWEFRHFLVVNFHFFYRIVELRLAAVLREFEVSSTSIIALGKSYSRPCLLVHQTRLGLQVRVIKPSRRSYIALESVHLLEVVFKTCLFSVLVSFEALLAGICLKSAGNYKLSLIGQI